MPRTKFKAPDVDSEIIIKECFWKCPCGGNRPDPPDTCEYKYKNPYNKHKCCISMTVCNFFCSCNETCNFYIDWKKKSSKRYKRTSTLKQPPKEEKIQPSQKSGRTKRL